MTILNPRCFNCKRVLPNWDDFCKLREKYGSVKEALDKITITHKDHTRHLVHGCCRRMLITHIDLMDRMIALTRLDSTPLGLSKEDDTSLALVSELDLGKFSFQSG